MTVRRRLVAVLSATALVLGATSLVAGAPSASAAPQTVGSSTLDWGVKASFRNYIVNISHGSITASGGATQSGGATGSFSWAGAGGSYDPVAKTGALDYSGTVVFRAEEHTIWDITIANPSVVLDGDATGTLVADVSYRTGGTEAAPENVSSLQDVSFGTVAVGTPTLNGSTYTFANQAVTLTAAGASAFNGFYSAGTELDPLTATATLVAPALTITTGSLPAGLVGKSYTSTQLATTGGTASYTYALASGSLPGGIVLSTSGKISGTPTGSGTSTFTVKVLDATKPVKREGTKQLSITIAPMTIIAPTIATGLVGKAYPSSTFKTNGGKATVKWDISAGALPAGLKMSSTGVVSGTPVTAGTYTATVRAADANTVKNYAYHQVSITIDPMTVLPFTPPAALVGKAITSATFKANGGKTTLVWTVSGGALPPGLKLSTSGALSGTPVTGGAYTFTVRVADASVPKNYAYREVTMNVTPMTVATTSVPAGRVGTMYTTTALKANGGKTTLVWSVIGGSLPPGLKLSSGGSLSGTPTVAGTYTFTVQVADASTPKNYATKQLTLVVT